VAFLYYPGQRGITDVRGACGRGSKVSGNIGAMQDAMTGVNRILQASPGRVANVS